MLALQIDQKNKSEFFPRKYSPANGTFFNVEIADAVAVIK
jgi:hypothetical protein